MTTYEWQVIYHDAKDGSLGEQLTGWNAEGWEVFSITPLGSGGIIVVVLRKEITTRAEAATIAKKGTQRDAFDVGRALGGRAHGYRD